MTTHPVQFTVEPAANMERLPVAIRLALMLALGALGLSSLYWLLYLALPAVAALLISQKSGERYLAEDAPREARALAWLASAYAYLWLLTDEFPTGGKPGAVELHVEPCGEPRAASALWRLLYSLPALLVLAVLSMIAGLLWVVAAVVVLVARRTPRFIADFFVLTLRYQFRLAAYHLSMVDRYPSLQEAGAPREIVP
jgi:hypothetical protein